MSAQEVSPSVLVDPLPAPLPAGAGTRPSLRELLEQLDRLSARTLFLALAVPVGLFLVFAVPPSQGLDEPNHFFRVYSISGGALVAPVMAGRAGDVLPACVSGYAGDLYQTGTRPGAFQPAAFFQEPAGCHDTPDSFVPFDNTAVYSPVSYLPQTAGVWIARRLHAPVPALFYAGRLGALLAFVSLVFLALSVAPRGRPVLMAVALMPMSLLLATQFSADGVTIALTLLLTAAVIRCCWHPDATWRSFLLAAAAALAVALSKSTYFVLVPLVLLAPARLFSSTCSATLAKVATLGAAGAAAGAWYLQVWGIAPAGPIPEAVVDPVQQLQYIAGHLGWYARFVVLTLLGPQTGYFTWPGFVSWVGFSRTVTAGSPAPPPLVMAAGIGLLAAAYVRGAPRTIVLSSAAAVRAALPVALAAANAALIVTVLYLTVLPVGAGALWLQGRYLLPLAAVPFISVLAMGDGEARRSSLLPLLPLVLVLVVYLVLKVPIYFYR